MSFKNVNLDEFEACAWRTVSGALIVFSNTWNLLPFSFSIYVTIVCVIEWKAKCRLDTGNMIMWLEYTQQISSGRKCLRILFFISHAALFVTKFETSAVQLDSPCGTLTWDFSHCSWSNQAWCRTPAIRCRSGSVKIVILKTTLSSAWLIKVVTCFEILNLRTSINWAPSRFARTPSRWYLGESCARWIL